MRSMKADDEALASTLTSLCPGSSVSLSDGSNFMPVGARNMTGILQETGFSFTIWNSEHPFLEAPAPISSTSSCTAATLQTFCHEG